MKKTNGWDNIGHEVSRGPYRAILATVGIILFISVLSFGGRLAYLKYAEPQLEDARREVFENTRSYITGNQEEIRRLKRQYYLGKEENRSILAASIRDQFSQLDRSKLDPEVAQFLYEMDNVR